MALKAATQSITDDEELNLFNSSLEQSLTDATDGLVPRSDIRRESRKIQETIRDTLIGAEDNEHEIPKVAPKDLLEQLASPFGENSEITQKIQESGQHALPGERITEQEQNESADEDENWDNAIQNEKKKEEATEHNNTQEPSEDWAQDALKKNQEKTENADWDDAIQKAKEREGDEPTDGDWEKSIKKAKQREEDNEWEDATKKAKEREAENEEWDDAIKKAKERENGKEQETNEQTDQENEQEKQKENLPDEKSKLEQTYNSLRFRKRLAEIRDRLIDLENKIEALRKKLKEIKKQMGPLVYTKEWSNRLKRWMIWSFILSVLTLLLIFPILLGIPFWLFGLGCSFFIIRMWLKRALKTLEEKYKKEMDEYDKITKQKKAFEAQRNKLAQEEYRLQNAGVFQKGSSIPSSNS